MHELLNTLYVQTQGAYLSLDHDTAKVTANKETVLRAPLERLGGIVMVGQVSISPFLVQRCAEDGRTLVWLDRRGRYKARVEGAARGNVLLRRAQHLALSDETVTLGLARAIVAGKIQNSRQVLLRGARDARAAEDKDALTAAAAQLALHLTKLPNARTLDELRGEEGFVARGYFGVFGHLVRVNRALFAPDGRTRRPPRDRMNAMLSFLYALVRAECASALEGVGLDPQVGFLHALRPGRPALALDLMEEFRPLMADRLALTLVNRRQLQAEHFEETPGGAVQMTEAGRRIVVTAFQERKEEEVEHRVLERKAPLGLLPHVQARLLARYLRGDLPDYLPYLAR